MNVAIRNKIMTIKQKVARKNATEKKIDKIIQKVAKQNAEPTRKKKKNIKQKIESIHSVPLVSNKTMSEPELSLNNKIAKLLAELSSLMMKCGEPMKARAYQKAEETILGMTEEIKDVNDLKGKPGFGPTILSKIDEYLITGTLGIIEREHAKPEYQFTNIYGVGPQKARELVGKGITSIEQLREKQNEKGVLNNVQKIGLKYYEDILERIPRKEIDDYHTMFENLFQNKDGKYEIVGSYRRGLASSGDIDVIITSENPTIFEEFLDQLIKEKVIVEVLSRGKSKCLVIGKIASSNTYRRVDFLYTSPKEYPFGILYFTGSKAFNAVMRGHALSMGYSMNEHGLSKGGVIITEPVFKEERDIFEFLKLQYIEPVNRIDGRNIIPIGQILENPLKENVLIKEPTPVVLNKKEIKKTTKKTTKKHINKNTENTVEKNIEEFKQTGISILDKLSQEELIAMVDACKKAYYNNTDQQTLLSDNEFDILQEYTQNKFSIDLTEDIGAAPEATTKNKVKLPFIMASMDKIKPDSGALKGWTQKYKGPYVLSCKLDGVSGLYLCDTSGKYHLYTRGDGHIGQDISHLIKPLKLPKMVKGMAVRGEFIMKKSVFEEKYKTSFANARNLVSGLINKKVVDEKVADLDFVTYEFIAPPMKPSEQMLALKQIGHKVVENRTVSALTNEYLSALLVEWRTSYMYEIDGVIVTDDDIYPRVSGNPDYAFAFKMVLSDQVAEAKVLDVLWTPSKDGYLKPRVRIEPIQLAGVRIEYATGFNGKFIEENRIGLGAVISLIRSGDVIPYIQSVTVPSEKAKMPDVAYEWTDTHVDIKLKDPSKDVTVIEKNITNFFVHLEVDGLSTGNIKRIMNAGFSSIPSILHMKKSDFEKVEGFKSKMIDKIYLGIQEKVGKASLLDIMVASGKFGRGLGERKIRPILDMYPSILESKKSHEEKTVMLKKVAGIGKETATDFVEGITSFLHFLKDCKLEHVLNTREQSVNTVQENIDKEYPFYGKKVVMTKTRDKDIITFLTNSGAILEDSMKKDTVLLIVKSLDDTSNKTEYAKKNEIPILSVEGFNEKYL